MVELASHLDLIRKRCAVMPDKRRGNNTCHDRDRHGGLRRLLDTVFLDILKSLHKRRARSNAHTLFNLEPIPTDNNIRNMLDGVPSERFDNLFLSSQADTLQGGSLARMQT